MKRVLFHRWTALLAGGMLLAAACNDDEETVNPGRPDPVPPGAVRIFDADHGATAVGDSEIRIDARMHFIGAQFAPAGTVDALEKIGTIPAEGWTESMAATPGSGCVAWSEKEKRFYALYPVGYVTDPEDPGSVIGADVMFAAPFYGAARLEPERTELHFTYEGGTERIAFRHDDIVPFGISFDATAGISVKKTYAGDLAFLPDGIEVTVEPDLAAGEMHHTVTLTPEGGGEPVRIELKIESDDRYFRIPDTSDIEADFAATVVERPYECNFDADLAFEVAPGAEWCTATAGDSKIRISLAANDTGAERTARIRVSAGGRFEPVTLAVKQDYFNPLIYNTGLNSPAGALCYSRTGAPQSVDVWQQAAEDPDFSFDHPLTPDKVTSDAEWCTWTLAENPEYPGFMNYLTFTCAPNDTGRNRETTVRIETGGCSRELTVQQSRYAEGDLYDEDGIRGIVFLVSEDFHGKIISLEETRLPWSDNAHMTYKTGATDFEDGRNNMAKIKAVAGWQTAFPAFAWVEAMNADGRTGWYLPAYYELREVAVAQMEGKIAEGLAANGGMPLAENDTKLCQIRWHSSTEASFYNYTVDVVIWGGGLYGESSDFKSDSRWVRAIRRF